jgi:hypothetical protein
MFALELSRQRSSKTEPDQPASLGCHIFALAESRAGPKISGLCERVIGQERTHISIAEHRRDWASEQLGGSLEFRIMDGSISRW